MAYGTPLSGAVSWFNLRQRHTVAGTPNKMQEAFAKAAQPPETKRPPGGAVAEGGGEAALPEGNPNTTTDGWRQAHAEVLAALHALYGKDGAK